MAFCPNCGSELPDGARFCEQCGTQITAPADPFAGRMTTDDQPADAGSFDQNTDHTQPAGTGSFGQSTEYTQPAGGYAQDQTGTSQNGGYAQGGGYAQNSQYSQPGSGYAAPGYQPYGGFSGMRYEQADNSPKPIHQAIRSVGSSPLFLIYIIIIAASIVMSFVSGGSSLAAMTGRRSPAAVSGAGTLVGILITALPSIFIFIGLLMGFIDCKSREIPKGSGIGLYKAGRIIQIVFLCIAVVLIVIAGIVLGGLASGSFDLFAQYLGPEVYHMLRGINMGALVIGILIAAVVVLVLALIYFAKLLRMATVIRNSLARGRRAGSIPIFPAVLNIILLVFVLLGLVGIIAQGRRMMMYYGSAAYAGSFGLSLFSAILSAAQLLIGAILILQLSSRVNRL